jgi:alpha-L-rhamnosidase
MNQHLNRFLTLLSLIFLFNFPGNAIAQKISLYDLKVEHLVNPLNIDNPMPRFSWKITSGVKNTLQTSYEIRLAKTAAIGNNPFWASSKALEQSILIPYSGPELASKTKYFWQVRIKDNHGNTSPWSAVQYFQTGLKSADWTAKWITVEGKDSSKISPLFRKEVSLSKNIRSAMMYVTAKGLYEANINGKRVSDYYFAPGWTSYRKHLQYQVYDVTASLKKGANALGVTLGDGWYKGRIGFGSQHNFYGDTRALLLQLEVEYTDGTKERINSDESWKSSNGPIKRMLPGKQ